MSAADATFSLESGGQEKEPGEVRCECTVYVGMQFDGTMKLMLKASTQGRGGPIPSHLSTPSLVLACLCPAKAGCWGSGLAALPISQCWMRQCPLVLLPQTALWCQAQSTPGTGQQVSSPGGSSRLPIILCHCHPAMAPDFKRG